MALLQFLLPPMVQKNGHTNQQPATANTLLVDLETPFGHLKIRRLTDRLVTSLIFDLPLSPPCAVDFGVDTANHYRALKEVLFSGNGLDSEDKRDDAFYKRVKDFDEAYGSGPKLNALVKRYAPQYEKVVHFHTSWDETTW